MRLINSFDGYLHTNESPRLERWKCFGNIIGTYLINIKKKNCKVSTTYKTICFFFNLIPLLQMIADAVHLLESYIKRQRSSTATNFAHQQSINPLTHNTPTPLPLKRLRSRFYAYTYPTSSISWIKQPMRANSPAISRLIDVRTIAQRAFFGRVP